MMHACLDVTILVYRACTQGRCNRKLFAIRTWEKYWKCNNIFSFFFAEIVRVGDCFYSPFVAHKENPKSPNEVNLPKIVKKREEKQKQKSTALFTLQEIVCGCHTLILSCSEYTTVYDERMSDIENVTTTRMPYG